MNILEWFGGRKQQPSVDTYIQEGLNLGLMGRSHEAIERFSSAIDITPSCTKALLLRGAAYSLLRRWDSAIADYSAAISLTAETDEKKDALEGRAVAYASKSNEVVQRSQQRSSSEQFCFTAEDLDTPIDQLSRSASQDARGDWVRTTTELMQLQSAAKADAQAVLALNPGNVAMQKLVEELSH